MEDGEGVAVDRGVSEDGAVSDVEEVVEDDREEEVMAVDGEVTSGDGEGVSREGNSEEGAEEASQEGEGTSTGVSGVDGGGSGLRTSLNETAASVRREQIINAILRRIGQVKVSAERFASFSGVRFLL